MLRAKYVRNAPDGNGTLFRGDIIQVPIGGKLGGSTGHRIWETKATAQYNLGTRLITADGRVFRYGRCGASLTDMKHGVKNNGALVQEYAVTVSLCAAGAKELTVTFNGDFWDAAIAEDQLVGGYISLYNSSSIRDQRMITSNTAVATAAGGACQIGIDAPIETAVAATFGCEILPNPYYDLRNMNEIFSSVMGMPASLPTTGQYFWIQTWGPCRITPTGAELGQNQNERMFVFDAFGSLRSVDAMDTGNYSEQNAGFVIEKTGPLTASGGEAAPFIMLQISP